MDDEESSTPKNRKRTESSGGSSDSELSEGWNIIDQADVTNQDVPSSDGESVEVIEAEEEYGESDAELERSLHRTLMTDAADEPTTESDVPAILSGDSREEMFDSSFRWFLIYATAAVLVSNMAFMIAENALTWNADINVETPSFLRDFPTTPRLIDGNNFVKNIPWAKKEDGVEVHEERYHRNLGGKLVKRLQRYETNTRQPYTPSNGRFEKHKNERYYKQPNERDSSEQHGEAYKNPNERDSSQQHGEAYKNPNERDSRQQHGEAYKNPNERDSRQQHGEAYKNPNERDSRQQHGEAYKNSNEELPKNNFGDYHIARVLNSLSETTVSSETKDKLNQVFLILDALHVGLNDLEDIVTENAELQDVLNKQKHKLFHMVTEMEYSVTKSTDRLATNILNKVRKLERRFEHQWCELEKRGSQLLMGFFHNCEGKEEKSKNEFQTSKPSEKAKPQVEDPVMESPNVDAKWDSFQYQVDNDSPGKEHGNSHGSEIKEMEDYYMLVKSEMESNVDSSNKISGDSFATKENDGSNDNTANKGIDEKYDGKITFTDDLGKQNLEERIEERRFFENKKKDFESKAKYYKSDHKVEKDGNHQENQSEESKYSNDKKKEFKPIKKDKYYDVDRKLEKDRRNLYEDRRKQNNENGKHNDDKFRHGNDAGKHKDKRWHYNDQKKYFDDKLKYYDESKQYETYKQTEQVKNKEQTNNKKPHTKSENSIPDSGPELIRKYLKENCEKGKNKFKNMYDKIKSYVDSKLRVPKEMFDTLFSKYCQVPGNSFKWEKRYNREHPKGDFREKNSKNLFKDGFTLGDDLNKNVRIVDITEVMHENEAADSSRDNLIMPDNQPRHWVFHEDETVYDNKSNLTGDWLFKAGETRTKMRWSHNRSDWLFDRAYHRRTQRSSNWFTSRRKNWYFRRAWARQNCRHSHDNWCDFSEEETVTVHKPSVNLR